MIFLGLFLTLAYIPGWTGTQVSSEWAYLSLILPFFLWRKVQVALPHLLGLAFLAYALTSAAWATRGDDAVFELWQLAIIACSFWLGSSLRDLRSLFLGIGLGLTVSSVVALWQLAQTITGMEEFDLILRGDSAKASGLFYNSVVFGEIMALTIVGLWSQRLYWLIPGLIPGLALSQSRGAMIALCMAVVLNLTRSFWILSAISLALIFGLVYFFQATDDLRLTAWNAALTLQQPFGSGPGSFIAVYVKMGDRVFHPDFVHNDYLDLLYQFGIGVLPLLALLILALESSDAPEWPILTCFLVMALYSWPMHQPVLAFIGAVATGRLCSVWAVARDHCLSSGLRFDSRPSSSQLEAVKPIYHPVPVALGI